MALLLVVCAGFLTWPQLSCVHPTFFPQIPFDGSHERVNLNDGMMTPRLSMFIENTLTAEHIRGLSVALIPKHGEPAFCTWGYRTEDGDKVTPDVRTTPAILRFVTCQHGHSSGMCLDAVLRGLGVQGVLRHGNGAPWRRF